MPNSRTGFKSKYLVALNVTNNNDSTMTMLKKKYFLLFAILLQNPAVYGLLDEIQETLGNSLSYLKKGILIIN